MAHRLAVDCGTSHPVAVRPSSGTTPYICEAERLLFDGSDDETSEYARVSAEWDD